MYRQLRTLFNITRLKDEMGEIYFNQVIETFAVSLISIFIPIYLIENGFTIVTSFSFMLVYWGAMFLLTPLAAEISARIGFKHTIIYRAPLLIVFFSLLFFVNYITDFIFFVALLGGFSAILYWVATNAEFVKNSDIVNSAVQVGYLTALPQISATVAPFIGAFLLSKIGFSQVFIIVISLIAISQIPFLLTKDYKKSFSLRMRQSWLFLERKSFAFFIVQGVIFANDFLLWNIFVYQKFGLLFTGLSASFFGAGIAILTLFVGKFSASAQRRRNMLIYGSLGYTLTCIVRLFIETPVEAFLASMLAGIFTTIISVPIYVEFCEKAKKGNMLNWVVFRDFWLGAGKTVFVILTTITLLYSSQSIAIGFEIAGMFSLLLVFLALSGK
ncbi:MAG: MFS transporter [Candidatus Aenigmatarchaeota archaeon]